MPTTKKTSKTSVPDRPVNVSTKQPSVTVKDAPDGWVFMTRQQAAKKLGVTERTIDRYIEAGHLKIKRGQMDNGKWANLVNEADVIKLRQVKATPFAVIRQRKQLPAPVAVEQPVASDTWTTIEAAAKRSGLPAAYLERLILRGELPARNVWEGTQASGASWRIHCADLDALRGVTQAG